MKNIGITEERALFVTKECFTKGFLDEVQLVDVRSPWPQRLSI